MHALRLAAGALAAALVVGATSASAADLDHDRYSGGPYPDRYSSAYEDQRYRDLYGPAPTYKPPVRYDRAEPEPPVRYYKAEPAPPVPPSYVYRDRDDDRYDEYSSERRGFGRSYDRYSYRNGCLARGDIRRRLVDEGWRDFRDLDLVGGVAKIEARRRGELYVLKVDRCSGDIVDARPYDGTERRPYAYDPGPARDSLRRPYY